MDVSQDSSPPLFVEIFARRGSYSRAAIQAGLRVISVDHKVAQPFAPIVALDLTSNSGVSILWDNRNHFVVLYAGNVATQPADVTLFPA